MRSGCEIPLHFFHLYQQPQRVWHDFRINIELKPIKTELMKVVTIDELIRILEKEIQEEKNNVTYTEEDATYSLGVIAGLEKSKNILKNVK